MFAKAVKDALVIARSDDSAATRAHLFAGLINAASGRGRLLGFRVAHPGRRGLHLLYSEIFARREYEFASKRPDPVILDCGANIGMATLYFKWRYPAARIAAFEPDPSAFALLEANVSRNGLTGVVTHNVALAGVDSTLSLHSPDVASVLTSAVPSRSNAATMIDVPAKRLSAFVDTEVDLLKLDV
ncbi:MAG: FkbM family methyltransferase, partial [Pseudonocardia sp.]|nr:FkbM family methyltransferase [Pseudonocardia sp.]